MHIVPLFSWFDDLTADSYSLWSEPVEGAVLSSLGFAGTVCQLSQLTKCRRLSNGLKMIYTAACLHLHGRLFGNCILCRGHGGTVVYKW